MAMVPAGNVLDVNARVRGTVAQPQLTGTANVVRGDYEFAGERIEPKNTLADVRLAKELLGWEPSITLEEGIAELKKIHGIE